MIEKGKGLVFGKFRTIQLIESYLQLIMRMFVNVRNKGNIEYDERVSKRNYGSKLGRSREDGILEKRSAFDNSLFTGNYTVYEMTDLKYFYDRKL